MLTRLIYASEPSQPLTPAAVQDIVDHARAANARSQITGMLIFDSGAFLQVLEGRREPVSETFGRIAQDKRHRHVVLLSVQTVDERLFGRWAMGFAAADASGRDQFLRFGGSDRFEPYTLSPGSAVGLLLALSGG